MLPVHGTTRGTPTSPSDVVRDPPIGNPDQNNKIAQCSRPFDLWWLVGEIYNHRDSGSEPESGRPRWSFGPLVQQSPIYPNPKIKVFFKYYFLNHALKTHSVYNVKTL